MDTFKKLARHCQIAACISVASGLLISQPAFAQDDANTLDSNSFTSVTSSATVVAILNALQTSLIISSQLGTDTGLENTDALLHTITLMTYVAAYEVTILPNLLKPVFDMANSWIDLTDKAGIFANNQSYFGNLWNARNSASFQQISVSQSLTKNFLTAGSMNNSLPSNANDLSYTTVLGLPIVPITQATAGGQDPAVALDASAQSFINNASGSNMEFDAPSPNWQPSKSAKQYTQLYNMLSAIQSFDSYLVGGIYNQKAKSAAAAQLTAQASSSDWFSTIATESLGQVLRQILMYTSQQYVQTQRLVELQEQQLAVVAMTNALLVTVAGNTVGTTLSTTASRAQTQSTQ